MNSERALFLRYSLAKLSEFRRTGGNAVSFLLPGMGDACNGDGFGKLGSQGSESEEGVGNGIEVESSAPE